MPKNPHTHTHTPSYMPQLSSLIPLVKKSKYHQKKAQINSFEDNLRTVKNYQQLFKNLVEELAELSRERERERERAIDLLQATGTAIRDRFLTILNQVQTNAQSDRDNYSNLIYNYREQRDNLEQELETAEDFRKQEQNSHQRTQNRFNNLKILAETRRQQILQIQQALDQQQN